MTNHAVLLLLVTPPTSSDSLFTEREQSVGRRKKEKKTLKRTPWEIKTWKGGRSSLCVSTCVCVLYQLVGKNLEKKKKKLKRAA